MLIEKDIPVPPMPVRSLLPVVQVALRMDVGDSIFCGSRAEAQRLYWGLTNHGRKACRRKQGGGYRIWRVS